MPGLASTRSPGAKSVTPAPLAITTPAQSPPGTKGGGIRIWYLPPISSASTKFTPAAWMRTSTCPGPGWGSGNSLRTRAEGGPYSLQTMARMS